MWEKKRERYDCTCVSGRPAYRYPGSGSYGNPAFLANAFLGRRLQGVPAIAVDAAGATDFVVAVVVALVAGFTVVDVA